MCFPWLFKLENIFFSIDFLKTIEDFDRKKGRLEETTADFTEDSAIEESEKEEIFNVSFSGKRGDRSSQF